jgi:hypothetical protein
MPSQLNSDAVTFVDFAVAVVVELIAFTPAGPSVPRTRDKIVLVPPGAV